MSRPAGRLGEPEALFHDSTEDSTDDSTAYDRAVERALRILERKAQPTVEVTRRLEADGFDRSTISRVCDRLSELQLLDDLDYARTYCRQASAKGHSGSAIGRWLLAKGIPAAIIDRALSETAGGDGEFERALILAEGRLRSMTGLSPGKQYGRLAGLLARRGYDPEIVHAVCRRVTQAG